MSCSSVARQKGNKHFISASTDFAPIIRLQRYQKALSCYENALSSATNDRERSSAYKNIVVVAHHIALVMIEREDIDLCFYYFKECFMHGNEDLSAAEGCMNDKWIGDVEERMSSAFSDMFDLISLMTSTKRVPILHRFSLLPRKAENRIKILRQLVDDLFHESVIALEGCDYRKSLNALTEIYTPLTRLEELICERSSEHDDVLLMDFVANMKEDVFKNRCISESMQKRMVADKMFDATINDAEDLNLSAIWQVIDFYTESIVLTRENDIEQEAMALSKLGVLYYKVLLQKERAKTVLMRVIQLAQSLQPRNLAEEDWFKNASKFLAQYQQDLQRKEEREREKARQKYLENLKPKLVVLKKNMDEMSIQKILVWLYTDHPPKHWNVFSVNLEDIAKAPGDSLEKLLAKAIVFYHPDKIDADIHTMEYKVFSEEIVKYLTAKYQQIRGC